MRHNPDIGIKMEDCIEGRLYRFRARNFKSGIYDGKGGFIGIREKFGNRYLFTEFHWDADSHLGTVFAIKDTGIDCPDIQNEKTIWVTLNNERKSDVRSIDRK